MSQLVVSESDSVSNERVPRDLSTVLVDLLVPDLVRDSEDLQYRGRPTVSWRATPGTPSVGRVSLKESLKSDARHRAQPDCERAWYHGQR